VGWARPGWRSEWQPTSSRAVLDGAWLVELAGLRDAEVAAKTVMNPVGLRDEASRWPMSRLIDHVALKRLLLVLDNCARLSDEGTDSIAVAPALSRSFKRSRSGVNDTLLGPRRHHGH
jgi:predicted ATPase